MNVLWRGFRQLLGEARLLISDTVFDLPPPSPRKEEVLLVRPDGIGDYMLFRQSLRALRNFFGDKRITLCGNAAWRSLAEGLDADCFDIFLSVERQHFLTDKQYRHRFLLDIRKRGFALAINPVLSRDYIGDSLVLASGAPERIGFSGPAHNISYLARALFNRSYTKLFTPDPRPLFELERNKEFLMQLRIGPEHIKSFHERPSRTMQSDVRPEVRTVLGSPIFFLGGSEQSKRWRTEKYARILPFVSKLCNKPVLLLGGNDVQQDTVRIAEKHPETAFSMAGSTTLLELAILTANTPLLVSNDSAASHMAAVYGVPAVVIANGQYAGRFHPYPSDLAPYMRTVYPPQLDQTRRSKVSNYSRISTMPINSVTTESVVKAIHEVWLYHQENVPYSS